MSTFTAVLSTPPLTIPVKKSDHFDWIAHGAYILEREGIDDKSLTAELHELNQERVRCLGCGADKLGLALYAKYYQQLTFISNRFIHTDVPEHIEGFKWSDAYNSTLELCQNSLAFEKANVLFNAAALHSQMAVSFTTSTPEDLNHVFGSFQASASLLAYVKEHFLHPPLHDISKPSLEFLSQLMLAQAQEAAAKKAVLMSLTSAPERTQQQPNLKILARLWQSSAVHFGAALKFWYSPNAGKLRENVQETVPNLIDQKYKLSLAISLYFSALWCFEEERVGEAISRLRSALDICAETQGQGVLSRQFASLQNDIIPEKLERMEKENGLIFHQSIPSVLSEIEPASIIQVQSLETLLPKQEKDLFSSAIPERIKLMDKKYLEEVDKLYKYEEHLVGELRRQIASLEHEYQMLNLFSDPMEYLTSGLENSVKLEAASVVKGNLFISEVHPKVCRLRDLMKSEIEANLEDEKQQSKNIFDKPGIDAMQRREFLVKLDFQAAVLQGLLTDLTEIAIPDLSPELMKMEHLVREYARGEYGKMDLPAEISKGELNIDEKFEAISLKEADCYLEEILKIAKGDSICEELAQSGHGMNADQIIKTRLKKYDPLALKLEQEIERIKAVLETRRRKLEELKEKSKTNASFKAVEEHIDKRKTLIRVYKTELEKLQYPVMHM